MGRGCQTHTQKLNVPYSTFKLELESAFKFKLEIRSRQSLFDIRVPMCSTPNCARYYKLAQVVILGRLTL